MGFKDDPLTPCTFAKNRQGQQVIVGVYVNDLDMFRMPQANDRTAQQLAQKFHMKDLGPTRCCVDLQIEYLQGGVFVHQQAYNYILKLLKRFNMQDSHRIPYRMVVCTLDSIKDPFRRCQAEEPILPTEYPYLTASGSLQYAAQNSRPDIQFSVNLLARFASEPTQHHWTGVKTLLRYINDTRDICLYFPANTTNLICGYVDADYKSYTDSTRSQTGYVFTYGNTAVSWQSPKQSTTATSCNHAKLIALHEATKEAVWLISATNKIRENSG